MNFYKITARIIMLALIIFLVSCAKLTVITEQPITPAPAPETKAEEIIPPPEVKPPEAVPFFQFPTGLPDRNAIGCVLPLSGKYGDLGNKALDAILLAAGTFDEKSMSPWKIIVEDSNGLPEGTRVAITNLVKNKNVIAIIAIAGSAEALDAAREAQKQKVPIILITAKEGVTDEGDYVFQHFLTPSQQIKALAKYAMDSLNCATISILYPKDDYGTEMVKYFRKEIAPFGGKVLRAIPYNTIQTDFTEEIDKVTNYAIRAAKKANADKPETKVSVSVDFDAIFIPDSYRRVKMITSQLEFYDVKGIKLLGTSLWNSPDLMKKGAEYLEGAVFADSFFVNSFYPEANDFVDIYYSTYSREPENIEALAYDTMEIIFSVLEDKEVQTREQFIGGLRRVGNYKGVTGSISFSEDRVARKTAFIIRVRNGKLEQVK
jgi:branched-chain amino acid transport system substrate-binding protein